jgi:tRNA threonylcarbamoyladenosine biosynthesis protein TsaB
MLLALDTATTTASLALLNLDDHQLLAELTWQARRRQTQDLLPALQEMLRLLDVAPGAITALAVTTGPGSFTGVRIGISTVKGMALGLPQAPRIVGIPTLSVTAAPLLELAGAAAKDLVVCAVIQAGRGRYNWVLFAGTDLLRRPSVEEHPAGTAEELAAALSVEKRPVWLVGEVGPDLREAAAGFEHVQRVDAVSGLRRAGQLARIADLHLSAGTCDSVESLQPIYLRNP